MSLHTGYRGDPSLAALIILLWWSGRTGYVRRLSRESENVTVVFGMVGRRCHTMVSLVSAGVALYECRGRPI